MTVKALYQAITGDTATHQRTIAAELGRESSRRRRAVALRVAGASLRAIGDKLRPPCSYGAADDLIERTMRAMHKRIAGLPRYTYGRSGRPTA